MKKLTKQQTGLKHGFRSGLEEKVNDQLQKSGIPYDYEAVKIRYTTPQTWHIYTPDFCFRSIPLDRVIIIETKGRFTQSDRLKHLRIKQFRPDLDIRFVFTNPNAKISKVSKTTYAAWCDKHGFLWGKGLIPKEWLV